MNKKQRQAIVDSVNEKLQEQDLTAHFLGDDPTEFAAAILGVSFNPVAVVYSYEKTIKEFMRINKWTTSEAIEWYEYNVIRGLPYFDNPPIFVEEA